jgi:hypothetical protein
MKNTGLNLAAVLVIFLFQITVKGQTMNTKENQNTTSVFPIGDSPKIKKPSCAKAPEGEGGGDRNRTGVQT